MTELDLILNMGNIDQSVVAPLLFAKFLTLMISVVDWALILTQP